MRRAKSNGENASPKREELNPTAGAFRQSAKSRIQRRERFAKGRRAESNGRSVSPKGDELNPTAGAFRQRAKSQSNGRSVSPKGDEPKHLTHMQKGEDVILVLSFIFQLKLLPKSK